MRYLVEMEVPFIWQRSEPSACAAAQFTNSSLLSILATQDDHTSHDTKTGDTHLQRIEAKLDLILQLLARSESIKPITKRQLLRLAPQQISWQCATSLPVGCHVQLQLELDSRYPQPMVICGNVISTDTDGWLNVEISMNDPAVAEAWEHWLFRLHRRQIAKVRHS